MLNEKDLLGEERGRQNEQIVLNVAQLLHAQGVDPIDTDSPPPMLTTPFSADDLDGIDLWVPTHSGLVGIQIKSSASYAEQFIKYHPNGKVIPVIIVGEHATVDSIKMDLLSAIKWAQSKLYSEE
jgi:hypothetical protein